MLDLKDISKFEKCREESRHGTQECVRYIEKGT